ncbi:PilY2 family type 4a fimbrial biogenesis protein [Porticoccus sp. GXU_MW_L64]
MKMVKYFLLVLVAFSMSAQAETHGRVDRIDYKNLEIVIDDSYYKLPINVDVRGVDNKPETLFAIKTGMYVRYETERRNNKNFVTLRMLAGPLVEDTNNEESRRPRR